MPQGTANTSPGQPALCVHAQQENPPQGWGALHLQPSTNGGLALPSGCSGHVQHPLGRQDEALVPPDPTHDSGDLHCPCPRHFRVCHEGIFIILRSSDSRRERCCFPALAGFTGRARGRKLLEIYTPSFLSKVSFSIS